MQEIKDNPGLNCFVDRLQDFTLPGFCGNHIVEPGEQCDCGLDYHLCRDPCCYPGYLTGYHRGDNKSARSCHLNRRPACLEPFDGFVTYGLILPCAFISVLILALSIGLTYDWQKDKLVYIHLRKKEEVTCDITQQGSLVFDIIKERWRTKSWNAVGRSGGDVKMETTREEAKSNILKQDRRTKVATNGVGRTSGGVKDQIVKMETAHGGSKSNIVKQGKQLKVITNGPAKYSDIKSNEDDQIGTSSTVTDRISFFSSTNDESSKSKNPTPKITKQNTPVSNSISSSRVNRTSTNLNARRPVAKQGYTPVPQRPAPKPPC